MGLLKWIAALVVLAAVALNVALQSDRALKLRVAVDLLGWDGLMEVAKQSATERLIGKRMTESRKAWHELLDAFAEMDLEYLSPGRGVIDPGDVVEGYRYLSHVIRTGFEMYLESDLLRPHFMIMNSATSKVLGDNMDAHYRIANIDPDRVYRCYGTMDKEVYISFTLAEMPEQGGFSTSAIGDINNFNITFNDDGRSYELFISKKRPDDAKNWLQIRPTTEGSAVQVITRSYYELDPPVLLQTQIVPDIHIELWPKSERDKLGPAPTPRDANEMARRLRVVRHYVLSHTVGMSNDPASAPAWFSFTPNVLGDPAAFRGSKDDKNSGGGLGAVDIAYSAGVYQLDPGQGLLMESYIPPECAFVNIVIWNRYLQTGDFRDRIQGLNRKQMTIRNDQVKILISPTPPPQSTGYDWIDSEGRTEGRVFWRFLLPDKPPPRPNTTVVVLDEL